MSLLLAVLILGLIILFHEFGHFLLAKLCGIGVLEFSLGMGPRLVSVQRGETRYSIKALPFGGSCMMLGEDEEDKDPRAFNNKPVLSRILVVAAGDAKVDNGKYKAAFGGKAKMLTPEEAVERVGHAVGGVCPFAVNEGVEIYLDESLRRFDTVFPAAGSSNSAIELTCGELERYASNFRGWVDVCKGWRPEEQA